MYLLEQILKLLRLRSALASVDSSNVVIDVFGVLCDAHFLECLQLLTFRHTLESIGKSDQVLECPREISLRLPVLGP